MNMTESTSRNSAQTTYLLDNAAHEAPARLNALAELFDCGTARHLANCGVDEGWRCLEIGGGGGSIAKWLADRVSPGGHVIATDIDTKHLHALHDSRIEIWRHDLTCDPLPVSAFDLIHARLVLVHIPQRDDILHQMIHALKPGGWLVCEEFDSVSMTPNSNVNPEETFLNAHQALARLMSDRHFERSYGRLLYGKLRAHGLVSVSAEARVFMCPGGSAGTSLLRANLEQLREALIDEGYITQEELDKDLDRLNQPDFVMPSSVLWTARGRVPACR
jgi:2-polyprenyl-3-methyl-5-hydroxy-6-metoxy-1,4-benzoquinol methylase